MSKLNGKVALITGGNSGIGLATAQLFIKQGAKVVVTARRQEAVDEFNAHSGDHALAILADASRPEENAGIFRIVEEKFGKIDILFLNAGVAKLAPINLTPKELYDEHWDTNFRGPYFTTQAALPFLNEGASIIFNTSVANVKGMPGMSVYAATKAGLRSLVRTLTVELAPRGIRVNAVSPGPIETPIYDKMGLSEEEAAGFINEIVGQIPLGRFGASEEVANAVLFLASSESSYVNGIELPVDGGMAQV